MISALMSKARSEIKMHHYTAQFLFFPAVFKTMAWRQRVQLREDNKHLIHRLTTDTANHCRLTEG